MLGSNIVSAKQNEQQFATKEVVVVGYDPQWKIEFEKIKTMICGYIGEYLQTVEHVGSTSVEGLAAKPIIDVDAVLKDKEDLPKVIEQLQKYGYEYQGDLGLPGREVFFRKRDYNEQEKNVMKYHFYLCTKDAKPYLEHIAFRNYLRNNPKERDKYQQLKQELSKRYQFDVDSYCESKTEFVHAALKKCDY